MVRHSQFQMPNTKWGASILCRSKMADLVPLKFAHKIDLLSPSIHIYIYGGVGLLNIVRHSQFQMPNTEWRASILCRSKMADLVPL